VLLLKTYLEDHFSIDEQEWATISSFFEEVRMPKNEVFIEAGKVCKNAGFILDGVMRYFAADMEGNEPTCYFSFEGHYIVDPFTFDVQQPSNINLKSVTDCSLAVISYQKDSELRQVYPKWVHISNAMLLKVSIEFANQKEMVSMKASQRYEHFVQQYPQLAQRVPLQYIASYLGIAQPSLSRLRKNPKRN
jgi:CRP-like cAMP-binding protein